MNNKSKYSKETLLSAINGAESMDDIFINLGLKPNGGSHSWLRGLFKRYEIDYPIFKRKVKPKVINYSAEDISSGRRNGARVLKEFLTTHGVEYKCRECSRKKWNGRSISLDVDHIDGNCMNDHISNLQFLCPNCHRQKTSDASQRIKEANRKFCRCGKGIGRRASACVGCSAKTSRKNANHRRTTKIVWPSLSEMKVLVWEKTATLLGEELGVSGNAVKKFCLRNNVALPPSRYWANRQYNNDEICKEIKERYLRENGASGQNRTDGLLITSEVLNQQELLKQ